MFVARTTRCWACSVIATAGYLAASSAYPEGRQSPAAAEQRREAILRSWREKKPEAAPFLPAETAWTRTLPTPPAAAGTLDDRRVYVPLRDGSIIALDRETGRTEWTRAMQTTMAPAVGDGLVYVATEAGIRAIDAMDGRDRWSAAIDEAPTAPLVWDAGWLFTVTGPGTVLAFRATDGHQVWRRPVGATSRHPVVPGGDTLYLSLADSRVVALARASGEPLWERTLAGTISEIAVGSDRVLVGSTDNFLYAFDSGGTLEWKWRNGGDVMGITVDRDAVYVASLDNIIRAVNRGNGNQRWRQPTGTRPTFPPRAFGGTIVLAGVAPALSTFAGETGTAQGTHVVKGELVGPPLVDAIPKPFREALITITREGVVEALRPRGMTFREPAPAPLAALPGRALARDRIP